MVNTARFRRAVGNLGRGAGTPLIAILELQLAETATACRLARAVAEDLADVGLGLETAAVAYGQGFVFLARERYDLNPLVVHVNYLINLASPKEALVRSSVTSLVHYMEVAASLDADGVVFHPGSHLGAGFDTVLAQVAAAIREVVQRSPPGRARLLVENSAGSGGCVGRSFEEVARIVEGAASDRVGVCLDTQHAFASGYDVRDLSGVARTLDDFDRLIGFERLGLVHANDSARALGSNADRHANIGEGEIGAAGFRVLLADPRMRRVPWVLEVPGPERKGPDIRQVSLLRELAGIQPSGGGASGTPA